MNPIRTSAIVVLGTACDRAVAVVVGAQAAAPKGQAGSAGGAHGRR